MYPPVTASATSRDGETKQSSFLGIREIASRVNASRHTSQWLLQLFVTASASSRVVEAKQSPFFILLSKEEDCFGSKCFQEYLAMTICLQSPMSEIQSPPFCPMSSVQCLMSDFCPMSDVQSLMSVFQRKPLPALPWDGRSQSGSRNIYVAFAGYSYRFAFWKTKPKTTNNAG